MKNLKMSKKITLSFGVVIACFLVTVIVLQVGMSSTRKIYENFYAINYEATVRANTILEKVDKVVRNTMITTITSDTSKMQSANADIDTASQEVQNELTWFDTNYTGDATLINKIQSQVNAIATTRAQIKELADQNKTSTNQQAQDIIVNDYVPKLDEMLTTINQFRDQMDAEGENAFNTAMKMQTTLAVLTVVIIIIALVITVAMAYALIRAVLIPVNQIQAAMQAMEEGNLEVKIDYESGDELGMLAGNVRAMTDFLRELILDVASILGSMSNGDFQVSSGIRERYVGTYASLLESMRSLRNNLNHTLIQVAESADQVSAGADQVSSGAQALSQGATEQASSVEELAATVNEISNHINLAADNAKTASDNAILVKGQAKESSRQMNEMLVAMTDISSSSAEIGKIIKTIEDIAFQTNILALNAAVEAARAGAAGKGFAVVADEVRNLAAKSAEASKNTSSLIETSLQAVNRGTKIANETGKSLEELAEGIDGTVKAIGQISDASAAQADSVRQVTQGIDQISSVVQTNSATSEESAAASEELSSQALALKQLVGQFNLNYDNHSNTTGIGNGSAKPAAPKKAAPKKAENQDSYYTIPNSADKY